MKLKIEPLTPTRWSAVAELFRDGAACSRCWCMYWRVGPAYRRREPEANEADFQKLVERGSPPGLIAFFGEQPVGWCQITKRARVPYVHQLHGRRIDGSDDDQKLWSLTCLYVRKGFRGRGITEALIRAALTYVRRSGGHAVEAYPLEAEVSASATGTGFASTFRRAGFCVLAHRRKGRPVMRYDFVDGALLPGIDRTELPAMTTNERLFVTGLLGKWDSAARKRDRAEMIRLLRLCGVEASEAIADGVLADPARYGV